MILCPYHSCIYAAESRHFKHLYIFPNMTISYMDGISFAVGFIQPIGSETRVYRVKYFKPDLLTEKTVSKNLLEEAAKGFVDISFRIFEEDRAQLENLQSDVKDAVGTGYACQNERRLQWFTETYFNSIEA